jgi:hypothetical protein
MTPRTIALAALAAAALALALVGWCHADRDLVAAIRGEAMATPEKSPSLLSPAVPRLECRRPPELHLIRFEDGSARLKCGQRLLIRVSVPG